jgi:hypothetical protein
MKSVIPNNLVSGQIERVLNVGDKNIRDTKEHELDYQFLKFYFKTFIKY